MNEKNFFPSFSKFLILDVDMCMCAYKRKIKSILLYVLLESIIQIRKLRKS